MEYWDNTVYQRNMVWNTGIIKLIREIWIGILGSYSISEKCDWNTGIIQFIREI